MGQANKKGSFKERKHKVLLSLRKEFPASMKCSKCGESTSELIPLTLEEIPLKKACFIICDHCDEVSFGFNVKVTTAEIIKNSDAFINVDEKTFKLLEDAREDFFNVINE